MVVLTNNTLAELLRTQSPAIISRQAKGKRRDKCMGLDDRPSTVIAAHSFGGSPCLPRLSPRSTRNTARNQVPSFRNWTNSKKGKDQNLFLIHVSRSSMLFATRAPNSQRCSISSLLLSRDASREVLRTSRQEGRDFQEQQIVFFTYVVSGSLPACRAELASL